MDQRVAKERAAIELAPFDSISLAYHKAHTHSLCGALIERPISDCIALHFSIINLSKCFCFDKQSKHRSFSFTLCARLFVARCLVSLCWLLRQLPSLRISLRMQIDSTTDKFARWLVDLIER